MAPAHEADEDPVRPISGPWKAAVAGAWTASRASRRLTPALLALGLTLAVASSAAADLWYEHYEAAQEALAAEDWDEAVSQLNQALEKKGDPGARARTYGMRFREYFPYLKLGIAYHGLGQLEAALQAFETEERLGAIADSPESVEELLRYRRLTLAALDEAKRLESQRVADIVSESLAEAHVLEEQGQIEEAMLAVGRALAVAPGDADAADLLGRLRDSLARIEESRDRVKRRDELVASGRDLLAGDRFSEASSVLRQALALGDDETVQALLDDAQDGLRASLDASKRAAEIERGITEATDLRDEGRHEDALARLQAVLALEPANDRALELERSLLEARAAASRNQRVAADVRAYLTEAATALDAGDFEETLRSANRALALDAGNVDALQYLARAYRGLNQNLLGGAPRQNSPPAIRFSGEPIELEDGTIAEVVRSPAYRLAGVVIDDTPVEIRFISADSGELKGEVETQSIGELWVSEFSVSHSLPVGRSEFLLIAADPGGRTSISRYKVVYRPSLARSPWLWGGTTAVLLSCGVAVVVSRRRRRRRLVERRFNPYTAGAPVLDEKLFFGRRRLIDRILQTLHNNSLLLHGERRIGKTTLQHHLKRRLEALEDPEFEFFPVYIDLQGTPEERFFATLGEEIADELEPTLGDLDLRVGRQEPYTFRDFVADLRAVLKTLRQRTDKGVRLVLLIDEVDELNSYDPRVNQKLRSLFMKSFAEDLVAVVSGVAIKREWNREGSPWYNFFEEIDVGPLNRKAARELVERPIQGIFRLEGGAVDRVIELAESRPYRIQHLCMVLLNHMYETGRREITVDDVEAVAGGGA